MISLEAFLQQFVTAMNERAINWCVLRNYEGLPELCAGGGDVDLLIAERDFSRCLDVLAHAPDIHVTAIVRRASTARVFVTTAAGESLHLDFAFALAWKGLRYVDEAAVLRRAGAYAAWPALRVADPLDEAICSLLEHYLWDGTLKPRYAARIAHIFGQYAGEATARLAPFFGARTAAELVRSMAMGSVEQVNARVHHMRRALVAHGIRRPATMAAVCRHYVREVGLRLTPANLTTVAVLGVDGAGKTTLLDALEHQFSRAVGHTCRKRVRPRIFYDRDGGRGLANPHPHAVERDHWLWSSLKMALWWLEFPIEKYLLSKPTVILEFYDRYFDDVTVDPVRYRYGGARALIQFMQRLVLQPDLYLILDAPAELVYARKSEIVFAELHRQRQAFLDLARTRRNAVVLDTSQPPEQVAVQASRAVLAVLLAKAEKQAGVAFAARSSIPAHLPPVTNAASVPGAADVASPPSLPVSLTSDAHEATDLQKAG